MGPVKAEGRAPVVHDQGDLAREPERLEPGVEVSCVIREAVGAGGRPAGVAHADEVGRQATAMGLDEGDHVAPEIRRCWIAVQEHHRRTRPGVHIGHLGIEDTHATARVGIGGGNRLRHCLTSVA